MLERLRLPTGDMDEVADIIFSVLTASKPTTTSAGEPSKAKFDLSDDVRNGARGRSADLLTANPLYPRVGLL